VWGEGLRPVSVVPSPKSQVQPVAPVEASVQVTVTLTRYEPSAGEQENEAIRGGGVGGGGLGDGGLGEGECEALGVPVGCGVGPLEADTEGTAEGVGVGGPRVMIGIGVGVASRWTLGFTIWPIVSSGANVGPGPCDSPPITSPVSGGEGEPIEPVGTGIVS
jgi:hypothetical protein